MNISKTLTTALILPLVIISFSTSAYGARAKIQGEYCYQYGDSESLMTAKEISYAMALRKAIETYKTFVSSTSIVKDFKLKKDIIEAIASGYVDDIKIVNQTIEGRTVCTTLVGYVNPEAVKSIISRKVEKVRKTKRQEFKGLISNKYIKILNYKREPASLNEDNIFILYQAKTDLEKAQGIIVDCFDKNGNPMEGTRSHIGYGLYLGEIRKESIKIPHQTASFELRFANP